MAGTTDSRASGFDATAFRDAIEFAQNMGIPEDTDQRIKFVFEEQVTYESSDKTDNTGTPYDLSADPAKVDSARSEVEVPVAFEFVARTSQGRDTPLGFILPSRIEAFILDTYIDDIKGADYALVNGQRYNISAWGPPQGLFEVTVYSVFLDANDQSEV